MGAMVSQITSLTIVYSIVYSGADQRKPQSSASAAIISSPNRRQATISANDVLLIGPQITNYSDVKNAATLIQECELKNNVYKMPPMR